MMIATAAAAAPFSFNPFDFTATVPSGFNAQNVSNSFSVSTVNTTGDSLTLNANTWLKVELGGYAVNGNTILEFDLTASGQAAEFVAVGFENDLIESAITSIRVAGTENWGRLYFPPVQVGETRTIRLNVGQHISPATYQRITFIRDDDSTPGGSVTFSNVKLFQGTPNAAPNINWNTYALTGFPGQNVSNLIVEGGVEGRRQAVSLQNNSWAYIDLTNYNITPNTVISFDFLSTGSVPEALGLGFYNSLAYSPTRTIQIGGTEGAGIPFTPAQTQGVRSTFEIPVGQMVANGGFRYLTFIRDADVGGAGTAFYANINLFEDGAPPPPPVAPSTDPIDFGVHTLLSHFGTVQTVPANNNDVQPTAFSTSGTELTLTGNTWKVLDLNYNVTNNTILEFDFRSTGTAPEVAGLSLDNPSFSNNLGDFVPSVRSRTMQFLGTQPYGQAAVPAYTGGGAWQHYTIPIADISGPGIKKYLMFISDDDALSGTTNISFRNVRLYELGVVAPNAIDLSAIGPFSVPGQDVAPTAFNLLEGGYAIEFFGNSWKAFEVNKVIGPTTTLTLTFQSTGTTPEISGVMVSNPGISVNSARAARIFGTELFGNANPTQYTGAGANQTIVIPIGTMVPAGTYKFLSFINDKDTGSGTYVRYRNIFWTN